MRLAHGALSQPKGVIVRFRTLRLECISRFRRDNGCALTVTDRNGPRYHIAKRRQLGYLYYMHVKTAPANVTTQRSFFASNQSPIAGIVVAVVV